MTIEELIILIMKANIQHYRPNRTVRCNCSWVVKLWNSLTSSLKTTWAQVSRLLSALVTRLITSRKRQKSEPGLDRSTPCDSQNLSKRHVGWFLRLRWLFSPRLWFIDDCAHLHTERISFPRAPCPIIVHRARCLHRKESFLCTD